MAQTRVLVVGAHPDDAEIKAGGLAARHAARGNVVQFVSVTDGSAGHHWLDRPDIAPRRREEATAAADVLGAESVLLGIPDGQLRPKLRYRRALIRLVREFDPDLLLTHRPNDYHPDHRYTAQLVQDATYMVRVPNVCSETPPLDADPVICYLSDDFEKPSSFQPDVVVAIDDVVNRKLDALHEHASQVYEWLPWTEDKLAEVPEGEDARREWLAEMWGPRFREVADRFRDDLVERYGEAGHDVEYAEAFEACEYGAPLPADASTLFP